eukprot:6476840-Amphidinium_carterae.2
MEPDGQDACLKVWISWIHSGILPAVRQHFWCTRLIDGGRAQTPQDNGDSALSRLFFLATIFPQH